MGWIVNGNPHLEELSQWRVVVGLCIASTSLMWMVCGLRYWVRRRNIQVEDYLIAFAAVCATVFNVFSILQTQYGLGLPIALRPKSSLYLYTLYNYIPRPVDIVGIAAFKLALCISWLKLIKATSFRWYRWLIIVGAGFSCSYLLAAALVNVFNCRPFMKVINSSIPGWCVPYAPFNYAYLGLNAADDLLVFLLPVPIILRLNLERSIKVGLCITFAMGLLTTVFGILRLSQVHRIAYGDHNSTLFVLYTALEINVGVMSSSWPILRSLVMGLPTRFRRTFGSASRSNVNESYHLESRKRQFSTPGKNVSNTGSSGKTKEAVSNIHDSESDEVALFDDPHVGTGQNTWRDAGIIKTMDYRVDSSVKPPSRAYNSHDRRWD